MPVPQKVNISVESALVNTLHGYDNHGFTRAEADIDKPIIRASETVSMNSYQSAKKSVDDPIDHENVNFEIKTIFEENKKDITSLNTNAEINSPPRTPNINNQNENKYCCILRGNLNEPYGFEFRTIRETNKHFISKVREGLPGDLAGLREGIYLFN